jgi:hypothetical protein
MGAAARDAVLALESSRCSNVPLAGIQRAPCSAAPIRTAYNRPGRLGEWNIGRKETSDGTAGALAEPTALHGAHGAWRNIRSARPST